jgi:peroxiredoxin (alkyl hydroperoxide reductase subunit C)
VKYPLVSDFTKEVSRAYGVLDEASGVAQRGLFIIDPEGVLKYAVVTSTTSAAASTRPSACCKPCRPAASARPSGNPAKKLLTVG